MCSCVLCHQSCVLVPHFNLPIHKLHPNSRIYPKITMSFIEIAFLSPTQDQEVFNSHWPVIANKLTHPNPGITAASQGSILFYKNHQNKNARTEFTNLVIIGE